MNASIDMYSPEEVAKSVGVTSATICNWCRDGVIKCNKVGDGNNKNRYEITEDEYRYLRDLARKYGPKKVLSYYRKDRNNLESPSIVLDKEYTTVESSIFLGVNHDGLNSNCRAGKINCRTVKSNRKGYKAYLIPGWELVYLKGLYDKFGRKGGVSGAMSHYIKDRDKRGNENMGDIPWLLDMDQVEEKVVEASVANHNGEITSDELAREVKYKTKYKTVKASEMKKVDPSEGRKQDYIRNEKGQVVPITPMDILKEHLGPDYAPDDRAAKVVLDKAAGVLEEPSDDKLLDSFIRVRELKRDIDNMEAKLNQMRNEYAELKGEIVAWL